MRPGPGQDEERDTPSVAASLLSVKRLAMGGGGRVT